MEKPIAINLYNVLTVKFWRKKILESDRTISGSYLSSDGADSGHEEQRRCSSVHSAITEPADSVAAMSTLVGACFSGVFGGAVVARDASVADLQRKNTMILKRKKMWIGIQVQL